MAYERTQRALADYDNEPTSGNADLVKVSFYLEADATTRACLQNPTVGEVRAAVKLREEHKWRFYANGSFCERCGAGIGEGRSCQ